MADFIMQIGIYVFAFLLLFLIFVFLILVSAVFVKREYKDYEPYVSVLVPCYNEEKRITRCLDSVFSSDYPRNKMEVIVIDDGSTDSTLKILNGLKKRFNFRIISEKHNGKSFCLNLGISRASHEIIFTVDSDTFVDKNALKRLVMPFSDERVGATNGSWTVENDGSVLNVFQRIEFHYNNLVRKSFSKLFNNGIWLFGAFACYRKNVLKKIGGFDKTLTEDMDVLLRIYNSGYRTVNVHDASGYTALHGSLSHFFRQRQRWWMGGLQALHKNKSLFSLKSNFSILFLFISQYWWTFFACASFFLIGYQIFYWLPQNAGIFSLFAYFFRWFSLYGPVYVLYKIPEWGFPIYSIYGITAGLLTAFTIVWATYSFNDRLNLKNMIGIFFYFPYTILLNLVVLISFMKVIFLKSEYFIDKA